MTDRMRSTIPIITLCSFLLCGCGRGDAPKLYPVTGSVSYEGKAVPDAVVTFVPEQGLVAIGRTDSNGKFSLMTRGAEGAQEGNYQVSVSAFESKKVSPDEFEKLTDAERRKLAHPLIPARYGHPKTSELTATVSPDQPNEVTIDLVP